MNQHIDRMMGGLIFLFLFWSGSVRGAIVADHNAVREFDQIPLEWLAAAKGLTLHYAHTSHGSQIISGALALESAGSSYSFAVRASASQISLPAVEVPPAFRMYDGNGVTVGTTYITPELYWAAPAGLNYTREVDNTGLFNLSMWAWCGQQSSNGVSTVQQYLDALHQLEGEYPTMRFIYMTGHTDGTQDNSTSVLRRNNQLVRDYVIANNKILFDFADIESWDLAGNYYTNTTDACTWCTAWCSANPSDCLNIGGSCAHSHPYNCKLKAKAFWWLMARLAGWPGVGGTADTEAPSTPTNLAATAVSASQINLSWTAATDNVGVGGYRIIRNGSQVATAYGVTYSDSGRSPSTTYSYTVAAFDAAGNVSGPSNSASATTPATTTNQPPTVALTSPLSGTSYTAPATISIVASASDSDGAIARVEFFQGGTRLGERTSPPFSYSWTGVAAGSYILTARATDNLGSATTSAALVVTVNPLREDSLPQNGFGDFPSAFKPGERDLNIQLVLTAPRHVNLVLYDRTGTEIHVLKEGPMGAGLQVIPWDGKTSSGSRVASGIYILQLKLGEEVFTKRMVVVK